MLINHTGNNTWQYTDALRVWDSSIWSPSVKIRSNVITPGTTGAEGHVKVEFDFVEGANLWLPFQLEMIAPEKENGLAEFYNLEAYKKIDLASTGVKNIWEMKAQGLFLRIGLKTQFTCEVDFQTLRQIEC